MSAIEQMPTEAAQRSAARHRIFAWVVLLASFTIFCAMLFGLFQIVGFFYNKSTVSVSASVTLDTGSDMTVRPVGLTSFQSYTAANGTVRAEISDGDTVRTGIDTQATITFPDGSVVHLFPNTLITINQIKANRFTKDNMSAVITQEPYVRPGTQQASFIIAAMLSAPAGGYHHSDLAINTCVSQEGTCDSELARIELSPTSRVRISIDTDRNAYTPVYYSRAAVLQGSVVMQSEQDEAPIVRLDLYQMGTVGLGGKGSPAVAAAWDELLTDGNFVREGVGNVAQADEFWGPPQFSQGSDGGIINGEVGITDTLVYTQQLHAVHFYRGKGLPNYTGELTDNATVLISQQLDRDLAPYIPGGTLRLSAYVKLRRQNVPGGGLSNVEYPLTFRVVYQNSDNVGEPAWDYGYYFVPDPNRPPVSSEQGKQIKGDEWVHVEIPNLLAIDQLKGMRRIVRLDIYAAGHEFDSLVTNISLSAR